MRAESRPPTESAEIDVERKRRASMKVLLLLYSLLIAVQVPLASTQACPNGCSGHGVCSGSARTCDCQKGYQGYDCSLFTCPTGTAWADFATGIDKAHNMAECSNMGVCDTASGSCTCRPGFQGKACERLSCSGECSGRGTCLSMRNYALTKDPGYGPIYRYDKGWEAEKLFMCKCDYPYYGPDCTMIYCPTGDDPLTGVSLTPTLINPTQYNEIQRISCAANKGYFTLTFKGYTTTNLLFSIRREDLVAALTAIPSIREAKVSMYGAQACLAAGSGFIVEFTQDFGPQPIMIADHSNLHNTEGAVSFSVTRNIVGNKENAECSNRGICDTLAGFCSCSTNFDTSDGYNNNGIRGDCGYATQVIQFCPGIISCSGHGVCSGPPTYTCSCYDGWVGADCSLRSCPIGKSWFSLPSADNVAHTSYAECSDMGLCDATSGMCTCLNGFTGNSCERLQCPGGTPACSGHGSCLDMATLATLSTVNGVLAGFTYGATANNPLTWDANKMQGCACDEGWLGYDCSQRYCPFGDDPLTKRGQLDEIQSLNCIDDGTGSVVLIFREKLTRSIPATASTNEVKIALEALLNIGEVSVEISGNGNPDKLCTPQGNVFLVTFLTEHGNLPILKFVKNNIDDFLVVEVRAGNKEMIECSGRGMCDRAAGMCDCFIGYQSSDGKGGPGLKGDCGYTSPALFN